MRMLCRYLSRLFFFIFFTSCFADCIAQQIDSSFTLLWYRGRRLNDSMLITPYGQTITYHASQGKVDVSTLPKDDVFKNVKKQLKNTEQRKHEIDQLILRSPHGTVRTGLILYVNRAMDEASAKVEQLAENSVDLVKTSSEDLDIPPPDAFEGSSIPAYLQKNYHDVIELVKAIRQNQFPPPPPPPPSTGVDYCFPCDPERQAAYKRDSAAFMKYIADERTGIDKAVSVINYFEFRKAKGLPYDSVRGKVMRQEMYDAIPPLKNYLAVKILQTWTNYNNDATRIEFLADLLIKFTHWQQIMGFRLLGGFPELDEILSRTLEVGMKYLSEAVKKKDYRVLLNVKWVSSLFRTAELLGENAKNLEHGIMEFIDISIFSLTIDARAKMQKDNAVFNAAMSGTNYFSAIPDSNCVLKWTLVSPDSSKMKYTLDEIGVLIGGDKGVYSGPMKWKSYPADLRLDFCNEQKDTAILFGFDPLDGQEVWTFRGKTIPFARMVSFVYILSFMDVKRIQAMAADPGLQARLKQQMMDKYKEFMAANPGMGQKDPSKMTPKELEQMHKAMSAGKDMVNVVQSALPNSFLFKDRLMNNSKIVFDTQLNGKELFPENTAIQFAIFKVKIEHYEEK